MAYTEFCCRSGGSNLNAGTLDGAAEPATAPVYTGVGDSDGTSVFTPSDGSTPASTVSVGQFGSVYVTAGATVTVFVGRIVTVAAGVNGAITLSTTAKIGTFPAASAGAHTITCKVGGAWQGPNAAVQFPLNVFSPSLTNAAGDNPRINLKTDQTYSVSAAVTFSAAATATNQACLRGYSTTFGDGGRAVLDGGTGTFTVLTVAATYSLTADLEIKGSATSGTTGTGLALSAVGAEAYRVVVHGFRSSGIVVTGCRAIECEVYDCCKGNAVATGGFSLAGGTFQPVLLRCTSHDNVGSNACGVIGGGSLAQADLIDCVIDSNGSHGFLAAGGTFSVTGCSIYNNGGSGIRGGGANQTVVFVENNILAANGAFGIDGTSGSGTRLGLATNNAFFGNASGPTTALGSVLESGSITLSALPWVDAPNGDFRLNATAGGGAACRGAGRGTFTQTAASYAGAVGYPDVGAAQHLDAGGGGPVIGSAFIRGRQS